jgi:acyl-CoA reductase-like NAD-dependent aldehyde dehydrogenase
MSIQQSFNQGVSIASLLYTQTPKFKENKLNKEINKIESASETVAKNEISSGRKNAGIDAFSTLQQGQEDVAKAAAKAGNYEKKYQAEKRAKTFANITEGMRKAREEIDRLKAE